jgi:thiamine biosynthesis lipoprotein
MPEASRVEETRAKVDWRGVEVRKREAKLVQVGMKLDAGGIAKGDAVDMAVGALARMGVRRSLVSLAGDIAVGDPPPGERGWVVEVRPSGEVTNAMVVKNVCVSTSGDAEQFVEIAGVRYSHIVDPRSGLGVTHRVAVTVVAEDGAVADAMATALCVMPPEEARAFASDRGGMSVLMYQTGADGAAQFWQMDREKRIGAARKAAKAD